MKRKIVFVGGVHGVGKTTLCTKLSAQTGFTHYAASQLIKSLKAASISSDSKNVANIASNQNILLEALRAVKESEILLDGHFTILDSSGKPQPIGAKIFEEIAPSLLIMLWDDPGVIHERLRVRDGNKLGVAADIERHQNNEVSQARIVATALGVELHIVKTDDFAALEKITHMVDDLKG